MTVCPDYLPTSVYLTWGLRTESLRRASYSLHSFLPLTVDKVQHSSLGCPDLVISEVLKRREKGILSSPSFIPFPSLWVNSRHCWCPLPLSSVDQQAVNGSFGLEKALDGPCVSELS